MIGTRVSLAIVALSAVAVSAFETTWSTKVDKCWAQDENKSEHPFCKCSSNQIGVGVGCTGKYCDNTHLECADLPSLNGTKYTVDMTKVPGAYEDAKDLAGLWFTESSSPNYAQCTDNEVIIAINTKGKYGGALGIFCGKLNPISEDNEITISSADSNCAWSKSISEEGTNFATCPSTHALTGLKCEGKYCDNVSPRCCKITTSAVVNCQYSEYTKSSCSPSIDSQLACGATGYFNQTRNIVSEAKFGGAACDMSALSLNFQSCELPACGDVSTNSLKTENVVPPPASYQAAPVMPVSEAPGPLCTKTETPCVSHDGRLCSHTSDCKGIQKCTTSCPNTAPSIDEKKCILPRCASRFARF